KVTVTLNLDYTNDHNIVVNLISPDHDVNGNPITPVTVTLYAQDVPDHTPTTLEGFVNTTFDDTGASLSTGTPPYPNGTFHPHTPLAALSGVNPNGVWHLQLQLLNPN